MDYTLFKDTYVMYQLLEFIDESGIICLCKASKKLNEICKQYIEIEDDKRFEIIMSWDIHDSTDLFAKYCENNDIIKIRKMIEMNLDLYWDWGLYGASKGGHMDSIKFMIGKGANNWNDGLIGASEAGHIDIVKFMIEKGANWWNYGLRYACKGGYLDIVKLMIEKGATSWNHGLKNACYRGHLDIVKLTIKKGANKCHCQKLMEEHLKKVYDMEEHLKKKEN